MNDMKLIALIKTIDLPVGQYALFGGACLAIRNIRNLNDLDIFITDKLYDKLCADGWHEISTEKRKPYLITKIRGIDIQAFKIWEGVGWQPDIRAYIDNPEVVQGIPFMPLTELYKWKQETRRPKDLKDLKLIDSFLKNAVQA
jgi:hypothetical protein